MTKNSFLLILESIEFYSEKLKYFPYASIANLLHIRITTPENSNSGGTW